MSGGGGDYFIDHLNDISANARQISDHQQTPTQSMKTNVHWQNRAPIELSRNIAITQLPYKIGKRESM